MDEIYPLFAAVWGFREQMLCMLSVEETWFVMRTQARTNLHLAVCWSIAWHCHPCLFVDDVHGVLDIHGRNQIKPKVNGSVCLLH